MLDTPERRIEREEAVRIVFAGALQLPAADLAEAVADPLPPPAESGGKPVRDDPAETRHGHHAGERGLLEQFAPRRVDGALAGLGDTLRESPGPMPRAAQEQVLDPAAPPPEQHEALGPDGLGGTRVGTGLRRAEAPGNRAGSSWHQGEGGAAPAPRVR